MASGAETLLLVVLPVFIIAAVVEVFVAKIWEFCSCRSSSRAWLPQMCRSSSAISAPSSP